MSLLRNVFWLGILMLFLALAPDFGVLGPASEDDREKAGLHDLFYIISATVSDLGEICDRRPEVCEKLDRINHQFRNRAVRITGAAHDWLTGEGRDRDAPIHADFPARSIPEPARHRVDPAGYRVAETPEEQGK